MDVIANNVANIDTTRTAEGGPYRRQVLTLKAAGDGQGSFGSILRGKQAAGLGVQVGGIVEDPAPLQRVYDPQHPDADAEGFVLKPNISLVTEMTDLVSAQRAYEASATVMSSIRALALRALDIGRR
jgi:flagellar basal-body rod protein FlgC